MKKLLLTSVALMGLTASAMAADLPRRVAPAPLPVAVPLFSWTGFYAGVNVGYGFSGSNDDCDDDFFSPSCGFGGLSGFGSSLTGLTVPTLGGGVAPVNIVSGLPAGFGTGLFNDDRRRDGFVGGGQIGYNFQFTPGSGFVIGLEADAQYAGFRRNDDCDDFGGFGCLGFGGLGGFTGLATATPVLPIGLGAGIAPGSPNVALFSNAFDDFRRVSRSDIEWFGTVRGRLGYAIDRLLIYVTGGLAYTSRDSKRDDPFLFQNLGFGFSGPGVIQNLFLTPEARAFALLNAQPAFSNLDRRKYSDIGWTVGGGIEYAFTPNWTVKLEGLYVNFDSELNRNNFVGSRIVGVSNTGAPITATSLGFRRDRDDNEDFAVIRVGVNYLFSTGYAVAPAAVAPVAARY
jgi:outer membrane immunogenic protein